MVYAWFSCHLSDKLKPLMLYDSGNDILLVCSQYLEVSHKVALGPPSRARIRAVFVALDYQFGRTGLAPRL
jgi:hypothetical protein